jgi:hypothetical protein
VGTNSQKKDFLSWRDETNYLLGRQAPDIFRASAGKIDIEIVRHNEYLGTFYATARVPRLSRVQRGGGGESPSFCVLIYSFTKAFALSDTDATK